MAKKKVQPAEGGLLASIGEAPPAPPADDAPLPDTSGWAWAHKFADITGTPPVARMTLFFASAEDHREALTRLGIAEWPEEVRSMWWPAAPR